MIGVGLTFLFLVFAVPGILVAYGWIAPPAFLSNPLFYLFMTGMVFVAGFVYAFIQLYDKRPQFNLDDLTGTDDELSRTELQDRVLTYLLREECIHLDVERSRIVLEEPTDSDEAVRMFELVGTRRNQPEKVGYVVNTEKEVTKASIGDDALIRGPSVDDMEVELQEARESMANSQIPSRTVRRERPDGTIEEYTGPVIPGGGPRQQTQDLARIKQNIENSGRGGGEN